MSDPTPGEQIAAELLGHVGTWPLLIIAGKIDQAIAEAVYEAITYYGKDGKEVTVRDIAKQLERERDDLRKQLAAKDVAIAAAREDDSPGTPLGLMNALFDFAEKECGHNPASSRHALTTVRGWVATAKAQLAAKEAEAAAMRVVIQIYLDTCKDNVDRLAEGEGRYAALAAQDAHEQLEAALSSSAGADLLARLRAAEERNTALFGAARLVQESAFIGEAELRKQLTAAEEKVALASEFVLSDEPGHELIVRKCLGFHTPGPVTWKVTRGPYVLGRDGEWNYEALPSNRDSAHCAMFRFETYEEAVQAARAKEPV